MTAVWGITLVFLMLPGSDVRAAAKDKPEAVETPLEKPPVEFPQVDIVAGTELPSPLTGMENIPLESLDNRLLQNTTDKPADEYTRGLVSLSYGRYETFISDASYLVRTKDFNYSLRFSGKRSDGSRQNSSYAMYHPQLQLGVPLPADNKLSFQADYFEKNMDLPGTEEVPTPDKSRENEDIQTSFILEHKFSESNISLEPFYEEANLDNDQPAPDYRYEAAGLKLNLENSIGDLDLKTYRERLEDNYNQLIGTATLRLSPAPITDGWQLQVGSNFYGQENFGSRLSGFLELIYKPYKYLSHKLTLSSRCEPLVFRDVYLKDNYTEVNPQQLRPQRISELAYDLDAYVSPEWRLNCRIYGRGIKDYWFWSDDDGNGLYSPKYLARMYMKGLEFSTEYSWTDSFSNFFSLNLRQVKSEDDRFEFIPYIARQKISTGLTYKFTPKAKIDFIGEYFGRRYYLPSTKSTLRGYFMVNSKFTYQLKDFLTFYVLVDNLLNDHYEIVKGYPNQSRSAFSGVMVRF